MTFGAASGRFIDVDEHVAVHYREKEAKKGD
jgi:hypothetical protein